MPALSTEADRLNALRAANILDTPPDPRFDTITALARDIFGVPVVLISLIDEHRQWFKSNCGLDGVTETGRDVAFCDHAIRQTGIMVVEDAFLDDRFAANPLVTSDPFIRFYAGAPIITAQGHAFGTLCLIDYEPRSFSSNDRMRLQSLGSMVSGLLENHALAHRAAGLATEIIRENALSQAILESSAAGILSFQPLRETGDEITDFRIVAANRSVERITGKSVTTMIGSGFLSVFPGTRESGLFDLYRNISITGKALNEEIFYNHDGLNDWFHLSAVRTGEEGVTVTFTPITEQKRFEKALRELYPLDALATSDPEHYLSAVMAISAEALGLDYGFLSKITNNEYLIRNIHGKISGFTAGMTLDLCDTLCDLVVKTEDVVALNDISAAMKNVHPALSSTPFSTYIGAPVYSGGKLSGAISFSSSDKRSYDFRKWELDLISIVASRISHALELSDAFQKLRNTRDELQLVLDNVPSRIWYKDDKNKVIRANAAALSSVGLNTLKDVENKQTEDLFPDMAAKYLKDDLAVINAGEPVRNIIESYAPAQGKQGWISTDKIPMTDSDGQRYVLAVATDITQLKEKEEQLSRLNESLSNFAFVAAHDLQAPLRQASMFCELLEEELRSDSQILSSESEDFIREISSALHHMRDMVRSLYDLFNLDAKKITREPTSLNEVVRLASRQVSSDFINLTTDSLPTLDINQSLMVQLFQNLIENALKYSGKDHVNVHIHAENMITERKFLICIDDDGPGIPSEMRDRVFEPFKRLHHKSEITGAGIGLSLCRKIATLHDADLSVDPDFSGGARFQIAFNY